MQHQSRLLCLLVASAGLVSAGLSAAPPAPQAAPAARTAAAMRRGAAFLRAKQEKDGSWERYPGITALALIACLKSGGSPSDPQLRRAADYLNRLSRPDGAIYTDALGPAQALPNYNTALSILALNATRNPAYNPTIQRAQKFLERSQFDEQEGYGLSSAQYGGIGYGSKPDNPDMSNLQQALEALKETGLPSDREVFKKAIRFIERCQNRSESNDQPWAGTDGGFIYASRGESKADEYTTRPHSSYGSMTYAGLKSYIYCGVSKSDPRARAAYTWIRGNYSVEHNPGMKNDGLYYYYHTMSKTLAVYGGKTVIDNRGVRRQWAVDLVEALARRQKPDGSWVNTSRRWQEGDPQLVTAYALIALANCKAGL